MGVGERSLPRWILIVSGFFALLALMVSIALCFSPQSVLETVDLNAKGADYLIRLPKVGVYEDIFFNLK